MTKPLLSMESDGDDDALSHAVSDTEADPSFDALTSLAAKIFDLPVALVSIVEGDWQWFKSSYGIDRKVTPSSTFFSGHAMRQTGLFLVEDLTRDPRFVTNPYVTGPVAMRFFAGYPLADAEGRNIGVFSLFDKRARHDFGIKEIAILRDLALAASTMLCTQHRLNAALSKENADRRRLSQQLDSMARASPLAMVAVDLDCIVTGWNPAAEKLFGWREAEAIGRFSPHVPPGGEDSDLLWAGVYQNQVVSGLNCRRLTKSGAIVDVSAAAAPLFDDGGKIIGALGLYEDVSERKKAERELRRMASRLDSVLISTADAVLAIDRLGTVIAWNKGAELMFGYSAQEIVGRPAFDLMPARLLERYRRGLQHAAETGRSSLPGQILELCVLRRDGVEFPVELTLNPWLEEDELIFGVIMRDITDRKRLESDRRETMEGLEVARREAEKASHAKSQFLANMSHELRTPLNAVIGFSEMMRDQTLGPLGHPKYRIYADDIAKSGGHLLQIINDVLDLAKAESGKLQLREESIDLQRLLRDSMRLILPQAEALGHSVRMETAEAPPTIHGDSTRLRQVLINLLANAVKFTAEGGDIVIRAKRQADDAVLIEIEDNGIGIAAEDIPRAFEAFSQLELAFTRRFEGTGLGLPLSRYLVEVHGGTLTLASALGRGTRATIILPASRARNGELAA